jgi:hypothetical protein
MVALPLSEDRAPVNAYVRHSGIIAAYGPKVKRDDGTDDCASGADDVAQTGRCPKKYAFG